jgi:flagellum-specific ATP synthase
MERAGTSVKGSITGLYTVLVEGDDLNEPVADTARGILDGHIVLSRKLASMGHYPAIDVLESISRVMNDIISKEHKQAVSIAIENLATYRNAEDLISVGAYQKGTNPKIDRAIAMHEVLTSFLRQDIDETHSFDETVKRLIEITSRS